MKSTNVILVRVSPILDFWTKNHFEDPCINGGSCEDLIGDYKCNCATGFKGKNCEININECELSQCQNGATCVDKVNDYVCDCLPG